MEDTPFPNIPKRFVDDDEDAQFSDETTVDRRGEATGANDARRELMTVVEAVVGVELGASWIPPLQRQSAPDGPMKWPQVAAFVLEGTGEEARAARTGLGAQQIIVTDPMREARRLDLYLAEQGVLVEPASIALFAKPRAGAPDPMAEHRTMWIRGYLFDITLEQSGAGTLCGLMAQADSHGRDGDIAGRGASSRAYLSPIAHRLGGSLNKAAKLASKTTALVSPLLDPDRRPSRRLAEGEDTVFEGLEMGHVIAQRALTIVAEQRLVVDQGHQDITRLTQQLRDMAEVHAADDFFEEREAAFDTLQHQRREGTAARGYVRPDTDARQLRLQLADVAAGWARTIIRTQGYDALCTTFRCVFYNGRILSREGAVLLDRERHDHGRLMRQYAMS